MTILASRAQIRASFLRWALFLVPLVAVFLMPGAVAGATLLVRDLWPAAAPDDAVPGGDVPSAGLPQPAASATSACIAKASRSRASTSTTCC